jgi:hypothetical protein
MRVAGASTTGAAVAGLVAGVWLAAQDVWAGGAGVAFLAGVIVLPVGGGLLIGSRLERQPSGMMSFDGQRLVLRWVDPRFADAAPLWRP